MQPDEYHKMAEVEDRMWYYRALHRHVARSLTQAGLPADAAILDAGCGTGGLLHYLHATQPTWKLSGVDLAAIACSLARERSGASIAEASVSGLPFADGSFSAITSCDVLCQVEKPEEALREFVRCLRPDGVVVLTMPAYQWLYSYHDRQVANLRRYKCSEVKRILHSVGLNPVYSSYWNTLPFPLAVLRRKIFPPTNATSDVRLYPAPLEAIFNGMMAIEQGWLQVGGRLPYGSTVLVVARKPGHP